MPTSTPIALSGAVAVVMTAAVFAHPDDPKARDRVPPYVGPGFRAAVDGADAAQALGFDADGVQLLAWLPISDFGSYSSANDCWGYTAPSGREYAILGLSAATAFVEITNPTNPDIVEIIGGPSSTWRDVKVYGHYAYAVTEASGGGIQVMDLSAIDAGAVTLVNTITTGGTTSTHNVAIDTESGYLVRCGGGNNGLRLYDLRGNPAAPAYVGDWTLRYVHDAQVVSYPDGRVIAFCCSGFNGGGVETGLDILDVTDPTNIIQLGQLIYAQGEYSHQAWLSEDRQYLYLNDELDENGTTIPTKTFVMDVSDLTNPVLASTFTNGNPAIGHNLYVKGDFIYEANYRSGLRVFDAAHPLNPAEIAYFDTWPGDDNASFNGLWSCFPYFDSGIVIGSDIERGLFVWRVDEPKLAITLPGGVPELVASSGETLTFEIEELEPGGLEPGTATLHYATSGSPVADTMPLQNTGGDTFSATLPSLPCPDELAFYVSVVDSDGFTIYFPSSAPAAPFVSRIADGAGVAFTDDMETDGGWTVENVELEDGGWDRGVPAGGGERGDPAVDFDGSGQCWLTDNVAGNSDVDGGPTYLISPPIELGADGDPYISLAYWFTNDDNDGDPFLIHIANENVDWQLVESGEPAFAWQVVTFRAADYLAPGDGPIQLRFTVSDNPNDSVTEAAVDAIEVVSYDCDPAVPGDIDGDGVVGFSDLLALLADWGDCPAPPASCPADLDDSGGVGFEDLLALLAGWS